LAGLGLLLYKAFSKPKNNQGFKGLGGTITSTMTRKNGIIIHHGIRGQWENSGKTNAEINLKAGTIRIYGERNERTFDRTFRVGDEAEYDSWNMNYLAPIIAIGPKTVTFKKAGNGYPDRRLDLSEFIARNYNLNVEKIKKYNSEYLD